ncbi:MAG: hypothetical protein KAR40_00455 [Candidatus Sabulitectum sp.]|nr:hypothetical protein [Candidatus Sabulitectum sp.]
MKDSVTDHRIEKLFINADLPKPETADFTIRRKRNVYPGRRDLLVHDNTRHTTEMGIDAGDGFSSDLQWGEMKREGLM